MNIRKLLDFVGLNDVLVKQALLNLNSYQIDTIPKLDVEINVNENIDLEKEAQNIAKKVLSQLNINPKLED